MDNHPAMTLDGTEIYRVPVVSENGIIWPDFGTWHETTEEEWTAYETYWNEQNMEEYTGKHVAVCTENRDECTGEENVTFAPNPYQHDVNDDDTPVWICEYCREESAMDI